MLVKINNSKKKLSELTTLRAEKESKLRAHEEEELISEMGQSSDLKAKSAVQMYYQAQEAEEKGFRDEAYQILLDLRKDKLKYNQFLEVVFQRFASQEDLPKKFGIFSKGNDKGVVIGIKGTLYRKAFASCGMPPYDYHACKIMAVQLGNTVAKLMGYTRQTESGIILPDSDDLEQIKHGRLTH